MRDFRTFSPTWDISIKFLTLGLKEPCRIGGKKKRKSQSGWKTPRNRDHLNQQDPHTYELTETEYTGPAQKWLHAPIPNPEAIYN